MVDCLDNKTKLFALRVIKLSRYLMEEKKEYILSKQVLRSGTSIGANVRERKNAQSKLDFINKLSVALKEADETVYWLELLVGSEYIDNKMYKSLESDLKEIIALITASINTARSNL
jgi:four helix bundle protein